MIENKGNLSILFFTMVVVMLGFGMIIPILPFYIEIFGAGGSALGGLMATYGIMQFIFAPIWGQLSDKVGRKKILMVGVLGNAFAQLMFGLSTQLWMLFAARALAGLLSSATLPTAMAYIGDTTSKENRGGGMGMVGASMGVGMVLGPGIGGWLGGQSLSLPFFVASALSIFALLLIFLFLPESLRKEEQADGRQKLHGPQFSVLWKALLGPTGFLFLMAFILSFGLTNFEAVFGLYSAAKHQYGPQTVGWIFAVIGIASAIVQGGLTGLSTRRWGEVNVIRASLVGSAAGFLLMTQARTLVEVLITVCFFVVSNAMLIPATSALISKRAATGQGTAMGLNNSFMSLGRIAGPLWAGLLFDINIEYPYISGALVMVIGFLLAINWLSHEHQQVEIPNRATEKLS
jgi:MFS transporter, DHA1 family, multidrug resistance protein